MRRVSPITSNSRPKDCCICITVYETSASSYPTTGPSGSLGYTPICFQNTLADLTTNIEKEGGEFARALSGDESRLGRRGREVVRPHHKEEHMFGLKGTGKSCQV